MTRQWPAGQDPFEALVELPGVFEAVEAARATVDALRRDLRGPALRRRVPEVTTLALRRSARASTALELGEPLDGWVWEDFGPPFGSDPRGLVAAGALRLSAELASLAPVWDRAPAQALARAHVLATSALVPAGLVEADVVGRPRPGAADRLVGLTATLQLPTSAPAVVVAAVVHGELMAVRPFGTGDGVVARAASRLVLVTRGLDPQAVTVPEEGHLSPDAGSYAAALEGYGSGTQEGVAAWVVHCAAALAVGAGIGRDLAAAAAVSGTPPSPPPPSPR